MKSSKNKLYFIDGKYYTETNERNMEEPVMSVALNYQLSILGQYSISPTPEIVTTLMTAINRETNEVFLPNIINCQQIEIPSNKITIRPNLGFVSQDQKYSIIMLNDRIDINYNRIPNIDIEMGGFYTLAKNALSAIMRDLNLFANRLAINVQMLLEFEDTDKLRDLGKDLIKGAQYYSDKVFCEWSTRINSQSSIQIADGCEKINVIAEISTAQAIQEQKPAILYHIDINTLPLNTGMRFNYESISPFVESAMPVARQLINDIERLISDERRNDSKRSTGTKR